MIRAQRELGATVFLNSHLLSEVEVTCDSVAFLKDGINEENKPQLHQAADRER